LNDDLANEYLMTGDPNKLKGDSEMDSERATDLVKSDLDDSDDE
jgi:hypothetical protein